MAWKKANRDLIDRLEQMVAAYPADRRFMFGSPTFFVNGNMFAGVHQDTIILRLPAAEREAVMAADPEVTLFTPMEGRPMKEYLALPYDVSEDGERLRDLVERSFRYAASLPVKAPKTGKKKKS